MNKLRIIISGGGTGGHIFPAIAIADAIRSQEPAAEILFVGAQGRMEMDRVPQAGYPIEGLSISGLQRKFSWQNFMLPFRLLSSLLQAGRILANFKPQLVIGTGGYASGPILAAAVAKGIPIAIQEQNAFAGLTNRLVAGRASRVYVAWEGMEKYFPAEKIRMTGNPVRQDIVLAAEALGDPLRVDALRQRAAAALGLSPDKKTILVAGGSLGARAINEAVMGLGAQWAVRQDVQWLWQCGKLHYNACSAADCARWPTMRLLPFIDRMDMAYALADLVVCRAGALTLAELSLLGKAAILVPSPNVAEDHQTRNALAMTTRAAALMLRDEEVGARLDEQLNQLLSDDDERKAVAAAARRLGFPAAAREIAADIIALIQSSGYGANDDPGLTANITDKGWN
jgi:UDP-N-acetylglucosamine--N-acetylmuramyl-(pentapeptide) pyrophosphoryl-undecaprenol N-acetylglucosamine transferase